MDTSAADLDPFIQLFAHKWGNLLALIDSLRFQVHCLSWLLAELLWNLERSS